MIRGRYGVPATDVAAAPAVDPNAPRPTVNLRDIQQEAGARNERALLSLVTPPEGMPIQPIGAHPIILPPPMLTLDDMMGGMMRRAEELRVKLTEAEGWRKELAALERVMAAAKEPES